MPEVEIVCLANSRKMSGRCVAGLRTDGGGWIRPISNLPDGSFSPSSYTLDTGHEIALLDVVRISLIEPRPEPHQPENWLNERVTWRLVRRLAADEAGRLLPPACIPGPAIFGTAGDRIPFATFLQQPLAASLALIEPRSIAWHVTTGYRGNRQTRARFEFGGAAYNLSVTDPHFEQRLALLDQGIHPREAASIAAHDRVLFTVSLGEPFGTEGHCFKLVAAVIVLAGVEPSPSRTLPWWLR